MSGKCCDVLADWPGSEDSQENQYLADLADILATPEGYRVFLCLLKEHGVGSPVSSQPDCIASYNLGLAMLGRASLANPGAAARLLADCFLAMPVRDEES